MWPQHEEYLRFDFLQDLKPDPHYGFQVCYDSYLIESVHASTVSPVGDRFKFMTAKQAL